MVTSSACDCNRPPVAWTEKILKSNVIPAKAGIQDKELLRNCSSWFIREIEYLLSLSLMRKESDRKKRYRNRIMFSQGSTWIQYAAGIELKICESEIINITSPWHGSLLSISRA